MRQGSADWLTARRATIGSSDIPIIVGESTYKSARTLAAEKLGLVEPEVDAETQELFDIGHLLQPALLRIYERKSGRKARSETGWRVHPQLEWATASLDGTAPKRRVVEAKWSNAARWRRGEAVPGDVQAQVQWQLFVTGWDVADVIALDHGIPRIEEVPRDADMIDNLVWFATRFHERLERGELPDPDGSESTRRTLARMHPVDDGTLLTATAELSALAVQLADARAAKKAADATEASVANAIRAIVGDASGVEGLLTLRKNADSVRVSWPAVAKAYRSLLSDRPAEELDAIESIHSETVQGVRVLRLL